MSRRCRGWVATEEPSREIAFRPSRVIHQDFTGVPAIVDLAAMRVRHAKTSAATPAGSTR